MPLSIKDEGCNNEVFDLFEKPSSLQTVQQAFVRSKVNLHTRNAIFETPLHVALLNSVSVETVKFIAASYPEMCSARDLGGCLPLHCVFDRKEDNDDEEEEDRTPRIRPGSLYTAKELHMIVDVLLTGYPESTKTAAYDGSLPLHFACKFNAPLKIIQLLVESNPTSIKATVSDQSLPLHLACESLAPSEEVVRFLAEMYPLGLEMSRSELEEPHRWFYPLHITAMNRHASLEIVRLLAEMCPHMINTKLLEDGKLPADLAYLHRCDSPAVFKWLISQQMSMQGGLIFRDIGADAAYTFDLNESYYRIVGQAALEQPHMVRKVVFAGGIITQACWEAIKPALTKLERVEVFKLEGKSNANLWCQNDFLIEFLHRNGACMREVSIHGKTIYNPFSASDQSSGIGLASVLSSLSVLKTLDLSYNPAFGDNAVIAHASGPKKCPSLVSLKLTDVGMSVPGVLRLYEGPAAIEAQVPDASSILSLDIFATTISGKRKEVPCTGEEERGRRKQKM